MLTDTAGYQTEITHTLKYIYHRLLKVLVVETSHTEIFLESDLSFAGYSEFEF